MATELAVAGRALPASYCLAMKEPQPTFARHHCWAKEIAEWDGLARRRQIIDLPYD
jgi:hypothetical protein